MARHPGFFCRPRCDRNANHSFAAGPNGSLTRSLSGAKGLNQSRLQKFVTTITFLARLTEQFLDVSLHLSKEQYHAYWNLAD